jgi:hypothetical protein
MKLIGLHILQSSPVSCLNRDDVGAPKSAIFGGVNRARIGQPVQLVNAFESPLRPKGDGFVKPSIEALEAEFQKFKDTWGVTVARECRLPGITLDQFCAELLAGL